MLPSFAVSLVKKRAPRVIKNSDIAPLFPAWRAGR
jgi:hypothetical protein